MSVTKEEFFDKLGRFPETTGARGKQPAGVRMRMAYNFGLDLKEYIIWVVGCHSADERFPMATDILYVQKHRSFNKAEQETKKLRKWFAEWKNDTQI